MNGPWNDHGDPPGIPDLQGSIKCWFLGYLHIKNDHFYFSNPRKVLILVG